MVFLDPVTGTAVPCGRDGQAPIQASHPSTLLITLTTLITLITLITPVHQGYVLKLPNKFLQQHGDKIRDGLVVLKCIAAIGRCAGLPLGMEGMPTNMVSMAKAWVEEGVLPEASGISGSCFPRAMAA